MWTFGVKRICLDEVEILKAFGKFSWPSKNSLQSVVVCLILMDDLVKPTWLWCQWAVGRWRLTSPQWDTAGAVASVDFGERPTLSSPSDICWVDFGRWRFRFRSLLQSGNTIWQLASVSLPTVVQDWSKSDNNSYNSDPQDTSSKNWQYLYIFRFLLSQLYVLCIFWFCILIASLLPCHSCTYCNQNKCVKSEDWAAINLWETLGLLER